MARKAPIIMAVVRMVLKKCISTAVLVAGVFERTKTWLLDGKVWKSWMLFEEDWFSG